MAVFSTQQVRQLYVVKGKDTPANVRALAGLPAYPDPTKAGITALITVPDYDHSAAHSTTGRNMAEGFQFLTATSTGDLIGSDRIWRQSIRSIKLTPAAKLRMNLPTVDVVLTTTSFVNALGNTVTLAAGDGNVYFIDFRFPGFQNGSEEEVMTRTVSFVWESGDWADAAVKAINRSFDPRHNLYNKLVVAVKVNATTVRIYAPEGKWVHGLHSNKPNRFEVENPEVEIWSDVTMNTEPGSANYRVKVCGTSTDVTAQGYYYSNDGKQIADLEWFCMGERADTFRGAGWPNYVATDYMVDPNKEYDVLDIHYYFQGEGFNDDKSEKQMTLVAEAGTSYLQDFYNEICGISGSTPSNPAGGDQPVENDNNGDAEPETQEAGSAEGTSTGDGPQL